MSGVDFTEVKLKFMVMPGGLSPVYFEIYKVSDRSC